ncbi:MAG: carbohydrate ABC transporter permease [Bacillota bacterium]
MRREPLWVLVVQTALLVLVLTVWAVPFLWMLLSSFKAADLIIDPRLVLWFKPTTEHYRTVFESQNFLRYLLNSVSVSAGTTVLTMLAGTLAAYAISRFQTGGRIFSYWIIFTRLVPPAVLVIPFYLMFRAMGLINTVWALILADATISLSFVVWTMRGFFDEIPTELEEAAAIDGCTRLEALWRVTLPLVRPGLVATTIFALLFTWNEFLYGQTLGIAPSAKTLPVSAGDYVTGYANNWGPVFATGAVIMVPVLVVVLLLQKQIVRGLTLGAIK